MRFAEVAKRLSGFSTPIFGVSWEPAEAEVTVARRVVAFLEDRRVLFNPYELEVPDHCVASVIDIRRSLVDELGGAHGDDDHLAPHLAAMAAACRKFLDTVDDGSRRHLAHPGNMWGSDAWVFNSALGELRGVIGVHVAQLAGKYGLDVGDDLASILPAETTGNEHDGPRPRRRRRLS